MPPLAWRHVDIREADTVQAPAASAPVRGERLRSRTASRVAMAGICGVLVVLSSFALWAASRTNQVALHAAELTHINDAYQQARFAVTAEALLEHEYRLEPSPDVRVRFERAARSLDAAVAFLLGHGDEADRQPIRSLTADHRRYVQAVRQEFDAVDAGDQRQVREIQKHNGPLFDKLAAQVEEGAAQERDETLEGLGALRSHVVVATPVIFGAGLSLLVVFCVVLVGYQHRSERQALHDGLTGLPNRTLLRDRTGQAIRQADRELVPMALALIDLDRFKEVNDTLGHHYGDQLLVQVGQRLQAALRKVDTVARLGGDEFAVLLPRVETAEGAVTVAKRLQIALEAPFVLEGLSVDVEASIGVTLYPEHGSDPEELLQRADIAMYSAKDTHAGFVLFDPTLDQHSPRRLALLGELRRAIDQGQLVLHYQPKVDAHTSRVLGVEALVRWQHPTHGLIPPGDFLPLAERTGLIGPLTHYVLDTALQQCHRWRQGGHELPVAVNVSARLLDLDFPDEVAGLLTYSRVPARLLVIEITESTIMADPNHAIQILARLNEMGVQLSIDDFGTGYSSMAYLKTLPVHELKVDRSFVAQMTSDSRDAVIVHSTIDLGRNLGLRVVAEGVEDSLTLQHLDLLGCHAAQGYHISRPVPAEDLITWLQHQQAATPNPEHHR